MSYTSWIYLVFLGITCLLYYVMPMKIRWITLLIANLAFYCFAGWKSLIYLFAIIVVCWITSMKIYQFHLEFDQLRKAEIGDREERKAIKKEYEKKRRKYLWIGVGIVLGALIVVKYTGFILNNVFAVAKILGNSPDVFTVQMLIPLGVSFFSFQMIAYLIDVYKGAIPAQKSFWRFVLYSSFFPSIVQGPIPRYKQLGEQLEMPQKFKYDNLKEGAFLILWGFSKKLILAERLAVFVNTIYDNHVQYSGIVLVLATIAYSFQIYVDFSSCMDIAAGSARLFGIKLAPNFLRPYFSRNLPEFWRRWHVSLGSWFRDYVFLPVSISKVSLKLNKRVRNAFGEKAGKIMALALPILVVWSLTGIWHGAEWKYVAWGMFHGTLILLSAIFKPVFQKITDRMHIKTECFSFRLFQMVRTFAICCVGRVFFRASDISSAFGILKRSISGLGLEWIVEGRIYNYGLNQKNWTIVIVALIVLLFVSILEEKKEFFEVLKEQNLIFRWVIIYALFFAVIIFGKYGPGYDAAAFIYEQF